MVLEKGDKMIESMFCTIIEREFEKVAGKNQSETRRAMHIGFHIATKNHDQYHIAHMYIFAPRNYVHVVVQEERIDDCGKRHVEAMKHLGYHDSCWRDSIQSYIFNNSDNLNGFQSLLDVFDWYDVITLLKEEVEYLGKLERYRFDLSHSYQSAKEKAEIESYLKINPFDKRSVWVK
jgi:ABC-type molybdate transport system substrate-binding protein